MRLGLGLGLARLRGSSIDPAAAAYFAATGLTGATEKAAVNTLVRSLKSAGLWSKMKAVYPFVTDNRNLLSYTEDFGNGVWNKGDTTTTNNATTAPNGTTTADKIEENTNTSFHFVSFATGLMSTTNNYTLTYYAKASQRTWCSVYLYDGSTLYQTFFDLANGAIGTIGNGMTASIESAGNGWYRCRVSRNMTGSGGANGGILTAIGNNQSNYAGTNGSGIFVWGAQLELGSTATTYQPIATTQQSYISNQFKYNLVNPVDSDAAFRLVFNGGWTMSNQGATPNGTNGYADTKLNAFSNLSKANAHLSFYSRTQYNGNSGWNIGAEQNPNNFNLTTYFVAVSRKIFLAGSYPVNAAEVNDNTTLGLHIGSAQSTTSYKLYKNASLVATNTTLNTTAMANYNIFIGGANANGNPSGYLPHQCAFSSIGDGLTDTEATALYNAVQTFNTSLARQVA